MKDINKILEKISYEKSLSEALTQKTESEYDLINQKRKNKQLKNEIKLDKKIILSGLLLQCLSFLGLLSTTGISIVGGLNNYSNIGAKIIFVIAIVFVQLVVFVVSSSESIVKQKFRNHYVGLKLIQYGLLLVSIYYNYNFFLQYTNDNFKIITLILCILLDLSIIKFVNLSYDKKILNYDTGKKEAGLLNNIFKMIIFNMFYKFKYETMKKYKENRKNLNNLICDPEEPEENKESIKVVENDNTKTAECNVKPKVYRLPKGNLRLLTCVKTTNKAECKRNSTTEDSEKKQIGFYMNNQDLKVGSPDEVVNDFSNEELEQYLTYVFENKTEDNISPGERKISDNTKLSLKKIKAIRYFLENKNIIEISNRTTFIKPKSLNESFNLIKSEN